MGKGVRRYVVLETASGLWVSKTQHDGIVRWKRFPISLNVQSSRSRVVCQTDCKEQFLTVEDVQKVFHDAVKFDRAVTMISDRRRQVSRMRLQGFVLPERGLCKKTLSQSCAEYNNVTDRLRWRELALFMLGLERNVLLTLARLKGATAVDAYFIAEEAHLCEPSIEMLARLAHAYSLWAELEMGCHEEVGQLLQLRSRLQSFLVAAPTAPNSDGACQKPGACGFENIGNTCFLNSALQCLSNTAALRYFFTGGISEAPAFESQICNSPSSMKGRLAREFSCVLRQVWSNNTASVAPIDIKKLIAERRPEFNDHQQHDAHELLSVLLSDLHEDVNRAPYPPQSRKEAKGKKSKSDKELADDQWAEQLKLNDSRIVELFQFQVRSELECPECQNKSITFDPTMCLSLPVPKQPDDGWMSCSKKKNRKMSQSKPPPGITLQQCFQKNAEREQLSEADGVYCKHCKDIRRQLKSLCIWSLPPILIVHLNRFGSETLGGPFAKICDPVSIPEFLDVSEFVCRPDVMNASYDLYGVVNHHGGYVGSGHYTAHAMVTSPDDQGGASGDWFYFDDVDVTKASINDLKTEAAYILFYRRHVA